MQTVKMNKGKNVIKINSSDDEWDKSLLANHKLMIQGKN